MTPVVVTHAVGNMDTWLGGGEVRTKTFSRFCSGHRVFKHTDQDRVSIIFDNVGLDKMKTTFQSSEAAASKVQHTVIEPIEIYIEVKGGS
ncbi:hypothetical protein [Sulfitobacter sp. MF3-043]|uniref:hypothetical protein n=1 Tax=Sulfitobacter sediminivivens TaxID=3252902 RepID=UPI0036DF374C